MQVLVTGADGFVAQNLRVGLVERGHVVLPFTRATPHSELAAMVGKSDAVVHLAGANRPVTPDGFKTDNVDLSRALVEAIKANARRVPVLYASSIQVAASNAYGHSKLAAEEALTSCADIADVAIFRLPNIFGKWARPFYNSAVATFCHQAARGLPLSVNDPAAPLRLVYVDDVVAAFLHTLAHPAPGLSRLEVDPEYVTTVGEVAAMIESMALKRGELRVDETGVGLPRALYATLLSHLPSESFSYPIPTYGDERGRFVEAVKTGSSGQFSYFTQVPGVERGGHYHHSKSEKFLVVRGHARFRFRHLVTNERVDIEAHASEPRIVDTIPGWIHDVQNLGDDELIVLIWASEVFDRSSPDTAIGKI